MVTCQDFYTNYQYFLGTDCQVCMAHDSCADKGAGAAISAGLHPVHPLDLK